MDKSNSLLQGCFLSVLLWVVASGPATLAGAADDAVRQGPQPLKGGELGVGRQVPDLSFTTLSGARGQLSDFRDRRAVVIALTGSECPLCLKYAPTLAAIEQRYRDRGVAFVFLNPSESEAAERLQERIETHGFEGPYVQDGSKKLSRALDAKTTTEVFVLDSARTLVYRGAVDDQYGFGYAREAPRVSYLTAALEQVLAGRSPDVAATSSPGCELFYGSPQPSEPVSSAAELTYHNRVSRIVQTHCLECHREGGIAPIGLETYEEVKDYAGMIRSVVERGIMPPWFAAPLPQAEEGETPTGHDTFTGPDPLAGQDPLAVHWANDRSLSSREKQDLFAWIEAGAAEGDPREAPVPKTFPGGWLIGEPDAIFEFPQPVKVKATGTMPYQNVTVETDLPEDCWVQAIEVRPGNPRVVHHVLVTIDAGKGEVDERDGYWGVYVPGNSTLVYPDGYAKRLPKGAKLRFQMHYTPNGTAAEDSTRMGVVFAKEPPQHEVKVAGIANGKLRIPPGAENHQEVAERRLPMDVQLLGFLPHMHLRGKAARYELVTEKGTELLLDVPRYDFNWQLLYRLAQPRTLKAGDTLRFTGWFDNSESNPANPDPTRTVTWGPQTEDEMHLGYVEYIVPGANPTAATPAATKPTESDSAARRAETAGSGLFRRLDANGDGSITREEVRERLPGNADAAGPTFDRLDQDRNGEIDRQEFARLRQ